MRRSGTRRLLPITLVGVLALVTAACNPLGGSVQLAYDFVWSYASAAYTYTGTAPGEIEVQVTASPETHHDAQVALRPDPGVTGAPSPWVAVWDAGATLGYRAVVTVAPGQQFDVNLRGPARTTTSIDYDVRVVDGTGQPTGNLISAPSLPHRWIITADDRVMSSTSSLGGAWSSGSPPALTGVTAVATDGSRYVAVGSAGHVATSPDTEHWTTVASGTTDRLDAVVWNGSRFVAVGTRGTIITSPDGTTWTAVASGTTHSLAAVTWTGAMFVAVGSYGAVTTSATGVAWTSQTISSSAHMTKVVWNGARFVAVGPSGVIAESPDGVTWTIRSSGVFTFTGLVWTGSTFVAVGNELVFGGRAMTSPDGISWTANSMFASYTGYQAVTWTGSLLVAVGDAGAIATSTDGITWTAASSPTTQQLRAVAWNGSNLVAVGAGGTTLSSPDGVQWWVDPAGTANFQTVTAL